MSTRSQIRLKSDEVNYKKDSSSFLNIYIYKHSDGYPEGVIPYLYPIVKMFHEKRGCSDGAYLLCQIIRHMAVMEHKDAIEGVKQDKRLEKNFNENGKTFLYSGDVLGWGLDCESHGDIAYLYEIDSEGGIWINGDKQSLNQLKKYCGTSNAEEFIEKIK